MKRFVEAPDGARSHACRGAWTKLGRFDERVPAAFFAVDILIIGPAQHTWPCVLTQSHYAGASPEGCSIGQNQAARVVTEASRRGPPQRPR